MKSPLALILCALLVGTFLISGCSSTKFEEEHGTDIFEGKGGEVYAVDGIEFWKNGEPNQKYRILGFIEQSHKHHSTWGRFGTLFYPTEDRDAEIAKAACKEGGDAVIFEPEATAPTTATTGTEFPAEDAFGDHDHQRFTLVVVKYVK